MARPRKTHDNRRTHAVIFHLTQSEFEKIEGPALAAGFRTNDFARQLVLAKADTITVSTAPQVDPLLIAQLNHLGHNLNQITRGFHVSGELPQKVEDLCNRIETIIDAATTEAK